MIGSDALGEKEVRVGNTDASQVPEEPGIPFGVPADHHPACRVLQVDSIEEVHGRGGNSGRAEDLIQPVSVVAELLALLERDVGLLLVGSNEAIGEETYGLWVFSADVLRVYDKSSVERDVATVRHTELAEGCFGHGNSSSDGFVENS